MIEDQGYLLALDVGGANVKAADSRGAAWSVPFELWKQPEELPKILPHRPSPKKPASIGSP